MPAKLIISCITITYNNEYSGMYVCFPTPELSKQWELCLLIWWDNS